jgi:DNA-binding SARP family transcriptional activator
MAGGIRIQSRGTSIGEPELHGRHVRLVLARFILERDRSLSRHELADALWSDGALPRTWESTMRTALAHARRFLALLDDDLGVAIVREGTRYRLILPAGSSVDVEDATELVAAAELHLTGGDAAAALATAGEAEAVLSQPVLPGVEGTWIERVRTRYHHEWLRSIETLATAAVELDDAAAGLALAERGLDHAPFRESLHRLVMRAHWAAGNRAEALRAYESCRRLLAEQMGVDPAPATDALYLELLGA